MNYQRYTMSGDAAPATVSTTPNSAAGWFQMLIPAIQDSNRFIFSLFNPSNPSAQNAATPSSGSVQYVTAPNVPASAPDYTPYIIAGGLGLAGLIALGLVMKSK